MAEEDELSRARVSEDCIGGCDQVVKPGEPYMTMLIDPGRSSAPVLGRLHLGCLVEMMADRTARFVLEDLEELGLLDGASVADEPDDLAEQLAAAAGKVVEKVVGHAVRGARTRSRRRRT
jgi:hypothetical protein